MFLPPRSTKARHRSSASVVHTLPDPEWHGTVFMEQIYRISLRTWHSWKRGVNKNQFRLTDKTGYLMLISKTLYDVGMGLVYGNHSDCLVNVQVDNDDLSRKHHQEVISCARVEQSLDAFSSSFVSPCNIWTEMREQPLFNSRIQYYLSCSARSWWQTPAFCSWLSAFVASTCHLFLRLPHWLMMWRCRRAEKPILVLVLTK